MSASGQAREEAILVPLGRHFEERGFQFFPHPPPEMVPSFLGAYEPAAIAYDRAGGGIVIEVKCRRPSGSDQPLSAIAKLFQEQRAWQFQIVYDDGGQDAEETYTAPEIGSIRSALGGLEKMDLPGQARPVFLYAWTLLEAAARRLYPGNVGPASTRELIERLTREGYLSQRASRTLRDLVPLRNAVAHGDLSRDVRIDDVEAVLTEVRGLVDALDTPVDASRES